MQEINSFIAIAKSLSELGITGMLMLSHILWVFIAKIMWDKYQHCLKESKK